MRVSRLAHPDPLSLAPLANELQHEWFVWDAWVAGKRRVDVHPLVLPAELHAHAVDVAERAWKLVAEAGMRGENELYRFHPDVERLAAAARAAGDLGSVSRVDLLLREDGRFVACEVNADCPGGYNETLALPRLARAAGHRAGTDPTFVATRLADRLVEMAQGGLIALAYATGYSEDLQICALLEKLIRKRGGRTVRIAPTMIKEGATYKGEPIRALYRFYPLEWMAGQRNIDALEKATLAGDLRCLSSFAFIHAQSKLAMARAFVHAPEEAAAIFPETRLFHESVANERADWVIKRDLSRVGDHVFVGALHSEEDFREVAAEVALADEHVWISQRFVPQQTIPTPWGPRMVTLGVYLLDGRFAGYFARLSPTSHCSHDALVLPVFV